MKKLSIILALGLLIGGCTKPQPVELQEDDTVLGITSIVDGDTVSPAPVDSSAMVPADRHRFSAFLQVANTTFDYGDTPLTLAFSRVLFEDRTRPVQVGGRTFGYNGIDLGLLIRLNAGWMLRIPHRFPHGNGQQDTSAGVEYYRVLNTEYRPNALYTWTLFSDTAGTVARYNVSIASPDDIVVNSPRGGSVIYRNRDLAMDWSGQGNMFIAISLYNPVTRVSKPILRVRMRANRRHAVLSKKILELLPPHRYVFSFVLENRKETEHVSGFNNQVLVQAASVYNSYVELR